MARSYNHPGYPKVSFASGQASKTSVVVGVGTVAFFDEINTKVGPNLCEDVGSANALVATLTDVASGTTITPEVGTCVIVKTANALQKGANTFNLNGHGTDGIYCQSNKANYLTSTIAAGAMLMLVYDGDDWQAIGW